LERNGPLDGLGERVQSPSSYRQLARATAERSSVSAEAIRGSARERLFELARADFTQSTFESSRIAIAPLSASSRPCEPFLRRARALSKWSARNRQMKTFSNSKLVDRHRDAECAFTNGDAVDGHLSPPDEQPRPRREHRAFLPRATLCFREPLPVRAVDDGSAHEVRLVTTGVVRPRCRARGLREPLPTRIRARNMIPELGRLLAPRGLTERPSEAGPRRAHCSGTRHHESRKKM
jgi:hypothetical protein